MILCSNHRACAQAEMSCLPLDHEALALLRRLRPQEALQVLQQAWMGLHFVNVVVVKAPPNFHA